MLACVYTETHNLFVAVQRGIFQKKIKNDRSHPFYVAVVVAWRVTAVSWRVPRCFLACLLVFRAVFVTVATAGNTLE